MDLGAAVVADEQAFELVEPGEGAFDDPAVATKAGAVPGVTTRDLGLDSALAELASVAGGVVAAVSADTVGPSARAADEAAHRRDPLDKRDQLGNVIAVATGERPGERDPGRVD